MTINELTFAPRGNYAESLKTVTTAFTPRQSVFFMPMAWTRAGNTQYRPEQLVTAFSESTPLSFLVAILKKVTKMTILSDTYDVYNDLRQILTATILKITIKTPKRQTLRCAVLYVN